MESNLACDAKYLVSLSKRLPSIMSKKISIDPAPGFKSNQIAAVSSALQGFTMTLYDMHNAVDDYSKCNREHVSMDDINSWLDKYINHQKLFHQLVFGHTKGSSGLDKERIEVSDCLYAYRYFTFFVNEKWLGSAVANELAPYRDDICTLLRLPSVPRPTKTKYCDKHGMSMCYCEGCRSVAWKCSNTSNTKKCHLCNVLASQAVFVVERTKCREAYMCSEHTSDEIVGRSTACCESMRKLEWKCLKHPIQDDDCVVSFCCVKARATNIPPLALLDAGTISNDEVPNHDNQAIIAANAVPSTSAVLDDDTVLAEAELICTKLRAEAAQIDKNTKSKRHELELFRTKIAETMRDVTQYILCHLGDVADREKIQDMLPFVSHTDSNVAYAWLQRVITDLIRASTMHILSAKRRRVDGS